MKRFALLLLLLFATSAHATVNEVVARNDYVAVGGTATFAYTFKILEKTQITVLVNGILRTVDTDYSVSGLGDSAGGTVTLFAVPASGTHVSLIRNQPVQQLSIYNANEAFPATRLMTDLDKNIMVDQMQEEELRRALKFGRESFIHDVVVDDPIGSSCLAWNGLGTRVVNVTCGSGGGGGGGSVPPIATGNIVFGGPATELSQDLTGHLRYDNASKSLIVGTLPVGPLAPGNVFIGLEGPSNAVGMQALMVQTQQGTSPGIGLVTLGDDRVGISSWNFRGTGATNPIYGANFGVVFSTPGVANGLEIDVQNNSGTANQGQALWLNGSGTTGRANAILIDTQDGSKWERGILFKEGFVGNGATGSISGMGIHFEQSQDADFIVIQPRLGTLGNVAFKVTDPAFTVNRFELLNSGIIRGTGGLTTAAFPVFSFVDDVNSGMYQEAPNVLGWGVDGLRRLTLGTALNVWNSGAGANQGGNINLFDATAVHSVGFLAADSIGSSFMFRLPTTPGTNGQCIATDGASPIATLSYTACSGSGGAGTVTTTGSPTTGALALFSSATAITSGNLSGDVTTTNTLVTTLASVGTTGTYSLVTTDGKGRVTAGTVINDVAHGGTGVATFTTNGVLYGNAATSVLVTAQGAANTVLTANAGAPVFSSAPTVASITTTAQGAHVIGPFGTSPGETGEVRFLERLANGLNYVGLRAPDSITANIVWTLPATDSTGTQCLASNGSGVLSWGACSAGSGTGLTSLNGLTGSTQTFTNDTNVTVASGGTAHVLGWAGTLASSRGGTGQNTSGSTGVPNITAGTWSVLAQLPKSLGGTGGTGGTDGQVAYWTATTLTSNAALKWDNATTLLTVGTGSTVPVGPVFAVAGSASPAAARIETIGGGSGSSRSPLQLVHSRTGDMVDGFATALDFIVRDSIDNVDNILGRIQYERSGADATGIFRLQTGIAGVLGDRLTVNGAGQMFFVPTTTTGTFGFTANGTRRTEVQFHANNNANAVSLIAPATATGNHVWTLPSTPGVAGDVLTNTGGGVLTWGAGGGGGGGPVSVALFGAVSNARLVTTGAMTATLATLTASGANFVVGDVGKTVIVSGAAASNKPLISTIIAHTNSTTVTLANVAGTTVSGASIFFGTNDDTAIRAALTAGNTSIYLPSGTLWSMNISGFQLPAGVRVTGQDSRLVWLAPVNAGASSFLQVGTRGIVENVTLKDGNTIGNIQSNLGYHYNLTEGNWALSTVSQNIAIDIAKNGVSGSLSNPAIVVNHDGLGSGDNYYSQLTANATQFIDALYRGDVYNSGNGGNGLALYVFNAQANFQPFAISDLRTSLSGSNGQAAMTYNAIGATSGTVMRLNVDKANTAYSGDLLHLWASNASGASFSGNFINATTGGTLKFKVTAAGSVEAAGNGFFGGAGFFAGNMDAGVNVSVGSPSGKYFARGLAGLDANIVVPCGTLVFTGGILTGKGTC